MEFNAEDFDVGSGFQITDAVPQDDGSLTTTLVDQNGYVVGTVTRLANGTATADVAALENATGDTGGFAWDSVLQRVTSFLDDVAKAARDTSDQAQRLSNAARGAAAGAQFGYRTPVDWKPYAIGAAVVLGLVAVAAASKSSRRRSH
jgi:hypothetical protein